MTNGELQALLSRYPNDMKIVVSCDRFVRSLVKIDSIVDIDTNQTCVEIVAEDSHGWFPYVVGQRRLSASDESVISQERLEEIKQCVREYLP